MKHTIGDYVVVFGAMFRKGSTCVTWIPLSYNKSRLGQVVGLATKYDGDIEHDFGWVDPNYFVPRKTHRFWQVKFGLMNKPVFVREEDVRLATIDEVEELPKLYQNRAPWNKQAKQDMREEVQNFPRDKNGRWVKNEKL